MDDMSVGQTGFSIVTPKGKKPLHRSNCNSRAPYKKKDYIICVVFFGRGHPPLKLHPSRTLMARMFRVHAM